MGVLTSCNVLNAGCMIGDGAELKHGSILHERDPADWRGVLSGSDEGEMLNASRIESFAMCLRPCFRGSRNATNSVLAFQDLFEGRLGNISVSFE